MKKGIVETILLLILLPAGFTFAQEAETGRVLSGGSGITRSLSPTEPESAVFPARLEYYLARAAEENPALRAAFYDWKAAVEKSGYAGALPPPTLSYAHFIENVETRVGPQEKRLGLNQSFPWFGTLGTRKDIALEAANTSYQKFEAEKLRLFYRVKAAYHDYYYLGREIAITRENLELMTLWESVTRAKYGAALRQHHDVITAQVELGKIEDRLLTVESMTGPLAARLRAALNLPDSVQLPIPAEIDIVEISVDRNEVIDLVLANNPDLKSLLHVIDEREAGKRLAAKSSLPSFTIGIDYIQTGDADMPGIVQSGKDPWMVKVGMTLPIWFGANRARKEESEAQYRKAENDYLETYNQLRTFAEKIVYEHENALRKTRLYRDGLLPKAEQLLNSSYTAYQAGEVDFLSLLDAQRQLLEIQLQLERSQANLATSRAAIEMITAKE